MILAERAVMQADTGRPNAANLLEPDGWVTWIGLEELEVFVGEFANRLGKLAVVEPEFRRGEVVQSGVQRPAS